MINEIGMSLELEDRKSQVANADAMATQRSAAHRTATTHGSASLSAFESSKRAAGRGSSKLCSCGTRSNLCDFHRD